MILLKMNNISIDFLVIGTAAILAVTILSYPDLDTMDVSIALEWVFYVILPNFCFGNALDAMYANQETMLICSQIDDFIDGEANRDRFCRLLELFNNTNPCCRGKLLCRIFIYVLIILFFH